MKKFLIELFVPLTGLPLAILIIASMFLSSFIVNALDYDDLRKLSHLYKTLKWEKDGKVYQKLFKVKYWKDYIPSISAFDKKNLSRDITAEYIEQYLLESIRAELCHDIIILFDIIFIILTPHSMNAKIITWAVIANLPCIIIQRYNRPRFEALAKRSLRNQGRK